MPTRFPDPRLFLRPATAADHPRHLALMQRIYPQAFAYLWPDDGAWYVDRTHGETAFMADLATADAPYHHVYFDDELVGIFRLKLNAEDPDFPNEPALKLDRLYLDDAVRGHGIGTALVDYAKAETKRLGKAFLWLERMDSNDATIGFYRKCGFVEGGQFRLTFELMYEHYRGMWRLSWRSPSPESFVTQPRP